MSSLSQAATAAEKRTNARYWIVVMLFIVTSFNYGRPGDAVDRRFGNGQGYRP